ncbi:DNA-directed RNA polymerase sigma-70 factor [Fulvitalea axinellae]|uniref:DNA-directed RNA polymerase sigma-70 factor n=1 Tax=Fulvitalea axinellae TaxID=1182444 RepID=A0AAU9DG48_9BACT|nr:DNA-directed RNA polymerase sigma-70 factor [Fulvitalea axinellae]
MLTNLVSIEKLRAGDIQLFERIVNEYHSRIVYFSKEYLGDEEEAREVAQDTFVKLWEKRETLADDSRLDAYLFALAKHFSIMRLRKRKSRKTYEDYLRHQLNTSLNMEALTNPAAQLAFNETDQRIQDLIDSMPKQRRAVFLLSRKEGLKYAEISEKMGISVKTVEGHMGKALKLLRESLKDLVT